MKISAAVPLALLIAYVVTRAEPSRRWRVAGAHIGTAMGIAFIAVVPFMQRSNPTLGMVDLDAARLVDRAARRWSSASSRPWEP